MKHLKQAGGIVTNSQGQVLVITNQIGKNTFPKGSREKNETPEENAKREIEEETGLIKAKAKAYLGVLSRPGHTADKADEPSVMKHIDMFHFTSDESDLKPFAADSKRARWVAPKDLPGFITST
jgi:ADP-ribose pyrophosphatase YjhB (NUDIX family)